MLTCYKSIDAALAFAPCSVAGGELLEAVLARGNYTEDDARTCFVQLLRGIAYLHSHKIVHRRVATVFAWISCLPAQPQHRAQVPAAGGAPTHFVWLYGCLPVLKFNSIQFCTLFGIAAHAFSRCCLHEAAQPTAIITIWVHCAAICCSAPPSQLSPFLLSAKQHCPQLLRDRRDLKLENLLLVSPDNMTHIKIADFGLVSAWLGRDCLASYLTR